VRLDVSLWSADLANLERDLKRVEPIADSFHFDVADAHFAPALLFFPDLVRALRPLTAVPFHVHLMVESPAAVLNDFLAAGADLVTVHVEVGEAEVRHSIARVKSAGRRAGVALRLETPVAHAEPFLDAADAVLLLGTGVGVKGRDLAPDACGRIREMKRLLAGRPVPVIADGGIRAHTVPLLCEAGADVVVPGSLVFGAR
jgi:ribulose-phosphate 3-epimerase